ncbi:MAG: hypothetical protein QOI01_1430, partial [Mycobacterium sp.]|nr:hypothetical protein [Mycobacterium sp.]
ITWQIYLARPLPQNTSPAADRLAAMLLDAAHLPGDAAASR